MKTAIISDIHGNKDALMAVLQDIKSRGITSIYNLGDSLYGPLFPLDTYELLVKSNIQNIRGNCDRVLLDQNNGNPTVQYVQNLLEDEHKEWISSLPFSLQTEDFYFCHGTPTSDEMYLLEEMSPNGSMLKNTEAILDIVNGISQNIIFCGHTHVPRVVYLPNNKIIINPGSIGLPAYEDDLPIYHKMESGSPFANYTIVSKQEDHWIIEQIHISYNRDRAIMQSEKNERLDWAIALKTGRI
ncbi:metallophosphoesterase family protein [Bacillus sp. JJ722]|uniref:metallophosphoesterase family protein n=1 Tax=Bacillus sp. JJ722 TaxID=3122973 RepID=UPI003000AE72